ncbi:MAG TPA: hypothetical protein VHF25_14555 [Nitriliruptorales bacterium]|nr:hypothetical protein [Nitriliruptorales bacterium]
MPHHRRPTGRLQLTAVLALCALLPGTTALAHPGQHGADEGHLLGPGAFGDLEFVAKLDVTDTDDLIADVAVSPDGNYAYFANWGEPDCAANSEAGGRRDPDAGVYVVDISDIDDPELVGFIPHSQDSRPGEGLQALEVSTRFFTGTMLVANNEQCGKNGKGGVSLYDVTDPTQPKKLSEHFGDRGFADTNDIHSAFAWDAGDRAYVVMTDNFETADVDILDVTNPKRPRLIAEYNLNTFVPGGVDQAEIGLDQSFLHDMVVKQIDGRYIMLLAYWDGGYVLLDVTDPANADFIDDTDFTNPDPQLLESLGVALPPEGNAHQAEFTADNEFFIGTDEDFSPFRLIFTIDSGPSAGEYPAGEFGFTPPVQTTLPDGVLDGPTVYGGYGCPSDRASIPQATAVFPTVAEGEERIIVFQRGPVGDPSASGEACFFSEKVESGQLAGYDAVIIANHHAGAEGGDAPDEYLCGSQGHVYEKTAPALCIGHRALHLLFDTPVSFVYPDGPPIGTEGEHVSATPTFDGWGYVHLYDRETLQELDTYAIDEAHDPDLAFGFGDLSVHEVATHPTDPSLAFLSYYSGGIRMVEIQCTGDADPPTCELVEVGGYLDPDGNDFWGVEVFVRDGVTYVLGSDRDSGLWIFGVVQ